MVQPQKHPLRPMSEQEERELRRIVKASSERKQIIDWLEQTVAGWNKHPTPFVWNGKRRRRRERARIRRLAGSGAALVRGYSIAS